MIARMFSKSVIHVEVLSLELCQKTEEWAESVRERFKTVVGAKNDDHDHFVREGRDIIDCGIRLMQVTVYLCLFRICLLVASSHGCFLLQFSSLER